MKKYAVLTSIMVGVLLLGGCGSTEPKIEAPIQPGQEQQKEAQTTFVGKIDQIVGNELSIRLLAEDFELTDEMKDALGIVDLSEEDRNRLEAGEVIELPGGGSMGSTTVGGDFDGLFEEDYDGILADGVVDPEGELSEDEWNEIQQQEADKRKQIFNKMDFSDEKVDVVVKAGIEIVNGLTASEGSLNDLKKGSIITVECDAQGNVTRIFIQYA